MSQKIVKIILKSTIPAEDLQQAWLPVAPQLAEVPGLCWKIWLINSEQSEVGGVYLFDDETSVQAFLSNPMIAAMKSDPIFSEASIKTFDIMEPHTTFTRGPLKREGGKKSFNQMVSEAFASVPVVKPDELHRWLQQEPKPLVIDVQDSSDIALMGSIPGAVNISLGSLTYKADQELPEAWRDPRLPNHGILVVTTCAMGPLGALGGKLLKDMGYTDVYILEGGVQAWIEAGYLVTQLA